MLAAMSKQACHPFQKGAGAGRTGCTRRRYLLHFLCALITPLLSLGGETLDLDTFLLNIREDHPVIRRENLGPEIEQRRLDSLEGGTDWVIDVQPSYDYNESIDPSFGAPDETYRAMMDVGLEREFWSSGGFLRLGYLYENTDTRTADSVIPLGDGSSIDIGGPSSFFANSVSLSYTQPLLRNRGGSLSRLSYDLQQQTVTGSVYEAEERQEEFLLNLGLQFLDWFLLDQERSVGEERLALARDDLARTRDKLEANLIEDVDLYRAEDAVLATEQALRRIESQWAAVRDALARQADSPDLAGMTPAASDTGLPEAGPDWTAGVRPVKQLDILALQLEREQEALASTRDAELDLVVFGNLKDGDESYGEATGFDAPGAGVALAYRYPLANRRAKADLERNRLESLRLKEQREVVKRDLLAAEASLREEYTRLQTVIGLNRRQVETAEAKTRAEQKLYEQGRSPFTFVIQSKDDEARARLELARNRVAAKRIVLRIQALYDRLTPPGEMAP